MGGVAKVINQAMGMGVVSPKSAEQPKVAAQMNNQVAGPAGPTIAEVPYDPTKRRGRKATILTSSTGATDTADVFKKTLLGG